MRILKEIRSLLGNYHVKSGIYHYYRGEYKQAADFLWKALDGPVTHPGADPDVALHYLTQTHLSAAERFEEALDWQRASEEYSRAADLRPTFPDIQFRLGRALQQAGHLEGAVTAYGRATVANPRYFEARKALAFGLLALGREDDAAREFQKVFELVVSRIREPYEDALRLLGEAKRDAALERFIDAFDRDPQAFQEAFRRGLDLLKTEQWENAAEALRRAISLSPRSADVHNYLGVALAEGGLVEDGILSFRRAIELNPALLVAHLNLAFALSLTGEIDEARAHLEIVLAREPGNRAAMHRLEEIRAGRIDPKRGVRR